MGIVVTARIVGVSRPIPHGIYDQAHIVPLALLLHLSPGVASKGLYAACCSFDLLKLTFRFLIDCTGCNVDLYLLLVSRLNYGYRSVEDEFN